MWWLLGAGILTGGALALRELLSRGTSKQNDALPPRQPDVLEKNFSRLREKLQARGIYKIAFIGQPGAGKSSLLANLTDRRCVPLPTIGPETDATDWSGSENIAICHSLGPFLFADAPGWGTERHPIATFKGWFPFDAFHRVVIVLKDKIRMADVEMYQAIAQVVRRGHAVEHKLIIARSFADDLGTQEIQEIRNDVHRQFEGSNIYQLYFVSNRTRIGIAELKEFLFEGWI